MALHIVIRTDASPAIGTGHVMRCLTLANALARKGVGVSFICREHEGNLCDLIEEQGFTVHRLPAPESSFEADATPAHAAWLGAAWQEDARQTGAVIRTLGIKPTWLVVDHYGLDYRWEEALRPLVGRIFVIDDLADRAHDCDLLLDQNLFADMQTRYAGKVPADCRLLLGPEYALLQPIYAELHDRIPPREGPVRRILISFGGADRDNLT
ncbi:MAG TPA: UDP-2,4-diacetamido-2,4,6-trideoxy-beta-L-altropyranose hydrolase, partial [Bacillota bacterium]|nr:UDP-2,4-diacetamido-2,4,6-trideoxy-beta-L-altropyranose hydrolase [Bacillota bacterium]